MAIRQEEQWMQQWRRAAVVLGEVRRRALAQMSEAEALVAANRVLAAGGAPTMRQPAMSSGLVEQQRILHRRRR